MWPLLLSEARPTLPTTQKPAFSWDLQASPSVHSLPLITSLRELSWGAGGDLHCSTLAGCELLTPGAFLSHQDEIHRVQQLNSSTNTECIPGAGGRERTAGRLGYTHDQVPDDFQVLRVQLSRDMLDRKPKITPDRIKSMQSQCKLLKGSRGENNSFHDGEGRKRKENFHSSKWEGALLAERTAVKWSLCLQTTF